METDRLDQEIARRSAQIYISITIIVVLLFLAATRWMGDYSSTARIGGAVWISLLTLIVSMPVVTLKIKKKMKSMD